MAVASDPGPAGGRRGLPRPPLRGRQPVRHPRQEGHHHAEGHPAGEADTRGLGRRRRMMIPLGHGKEVERRQRMKGVFYLQWRRSRSGVYRFDSENCAADAPCVRSIGGRDTRNIICSSFEFTFLDRPSHTRRKAGISTTGEVCSWLGCISMLQGLMGGREFSGRGHVSLEVFQS